MERLYGMMGRKWVRCSKILRFRICWLRDIVNVYVTLNIYFELFSKLIVCSTAESALLHVHLWASF